MPKVVDHDARRADLLAATWRVIARHGIEGATTREIAREAGCSTGVLAHYFHNKDEMLRLALDEAHKQVRARIVALRAERSGVDVLRAVLAESLPLDYQRQLEITLEVSFWARAVAQTHLRASQHADFDRWNDVVRELVVDAQAADELTTDLAAAEAADILVSFVDGLSTNSLLYPERLPPAKAEALLDAQIRLLGGRIQVAVRGSRRARRSA